MLVEGPDVFHPGEKLHACCRRVAGLILAAVYDDQGAEFASFFVGGGVRPRGGQEDGGNKHGQAEDGEEVAVPES